MAGADGAQFWTLCQVNWSQPLCAEPLGKPILHGVYVGQHLSFGINGKAQRGKPESTTGPGKSGRPGWNGGLVET